MVLERGITKENLKKYQEEYSVPVASGECGLMVIKASTKTKARQRKGAIGNWKVRMSRITNLYIYNEVIFVASHCSCSD